MSDVPERIWRLDCQGEILYLETPPYDKRTADSVEYIRADKLAELEKEDE